MMAKKHWDMMCDAGSSVSMMHDGYLKLFQLSTPALPFDYIMLNEYQDTNPVTAAIVLSQKCPRILVGDPYQGIYEFRGARNAMEKVEADQPFYLTDSFRFGPRLATLASRLLLEFFGETQRLIGRGPETTLAPVDRRSQFTTLCRTNAEIFYRAIGAAEEGYKLGFVGGVGSYNFEQIYDGYRLSIDDKRAIRDPFIRGFNSYTDYELYAKESGDREAASIQKVVNTFGKLIPSLIDKIKSLAIPNLKDAQRILSTAHKAKGMEFASVVLADDFFDLVGLGGPLEADTLSREEIRLTYVALTRASNHLQLNSHLMGFAGSARLACAAETSGEAATGGAVAPGSVNAGDIQYLPLPGVIAEDPVTQPIQGREPGPGAMKPEVAARGPAKATSRAPGLPSTAGMGGTDRRKAPIPSENNGNLSLF